MKVVSRHGPQPPKRARTYPEPKKKYVISNFLTDPKKSSEAAPVPVSGNPETPAMPKPETHTADLRPKKPLKKTQTNNNQLIKFNLIQHNYEKTFFDPVGCPSGYR